MTDVIEHQKSHRSKDTNATMASDNSETCPPSRVVFAVKMKISAFLLTACVSIVGVEAYLPTTGPKAVKPVHELQKAAVGAFAAFTIASTAFTGAPPAADAVIPAMLSSTTMVAETIIREGVYGEYSVDVQPQKYDDARSTFKAASETKSKKGKYTALLAILIVGSFIIPMAQYFWYVRDDDSTDKFFAGKVEKKAPPKKEKKWF